MILTTHAIIGAAAAELFPRHLAVGFVAAFLSHFIADSIPHWQYRLTSYKSGEKSPLGDDMVYGKAFWRDLAKIALDGCAGLGGALLIFPAIGYSSYLIALIGAAGGMLPDALQFLYWKTRREPLTSLQRFHLRIHAKTNLDNRPVLGIVSQAALVGVILLIAHRIHA